MWMSFLWQNSLTRSAPLNSDSQGRFGNRFLSSYDHRFVIKTVSSEDIAEMHNILKKYHQVETLTPPQWTVRARQSWQNQTPEYFWLSTSVSVMWLNVENECRCFHTVFKCSLFIQIEFRREISEHQSSKILKNLFLPFDSKLMHTCKWFGTAEMIGL